MKSFLSSCGINLTPVFLPSLVLAAFFILETVSCLGAATLTQQIDPAEANVGDPVVVTLTVQGGSIKRKESSTIFGMIMPSADIALPPVEGLQSVGYQAQSNSINDQTETTVSITLVPARPGDFTIPAFDIPMEDGPALHTKPMKLHVLGTNAFSTNNRPSAAAPSPATPSPLTVNPAFNSNGPVVMPPANPPQPPAAPNNGNPAASTDADFNPPRDSDGGPARVFMIITPQTTDAYVGQSIPMRIDFYIRQEVYANQNSLPTIKGSDFLMNNFTTGGNATEGILENQSYLRERWLTAISAPKSGDFPLSMKRDTYWVKPIAQNNPDPFFGGFLNRRGTLAHEPIESNQLTMHVHALPTDGRPPHFTGAIGQFKVTGEADPASVAVGEPVTLHFNVSGEGNFDYIHCPALADDPAWKAYVPSSKTDYLDESHTHASKNFEQSVIPQKNGNLPMPVASFSYFDPTAKQYVTVPIALPPVTVTGSAVPVAAAAPAAGTDSTTTPAPKTIAFLPNRLDVGSPRLNLTPAYRQPWFWLVQGAMLCLPLMGAAFLLFRSRSRPDEGRVAHNLLERSLQQEESVMTEAVRNGDAVAFFVAARHFIQLRLGAQWKLRPEAITLGEIRDRDPHLAESLEPLFHQADEVIYSGRGGADLDLVHWEQVVRTALLQPQPA